MREPTVFPAIALTGGTSGALDSYSLSDLQDGDGAIVMCTDYTYSYTFDADNSEVESSPDIITPDDAGVDDGRWVLTKSYIANNSDKLSGNIDSDFAEDTHADEHFLAGDDPISLATSTKEGLMGKDSHNRLWSPPNFRNLVINGNMHMWQRGTGATTGAGYQGADRWYISYSSNVLSMFKSTLSASVGAGIETTTRNSMRVTTTADSGVADYQIVSQRIEDVRTCQNKRVTVSFWTYCTTDKNVSVTLRQYFGTGGSPSAIVEIEPIVAESQKCSMSAAWKFNVLHFDVPAITGKTIGTSENSYLGILFWFSAGSDWNTLTDSLGHQSVVAYLTNVQLEEGDITTPVFEERPVGVEELLCYRYYWQYDKYLIAFNGYANNARGTWRLRPPVTMRTAPTASSSFTNVTYSNCDTLTWLVTQGDEKNGGYLSAYTTAATLNASFYLGSGDYIALSAEL